MHIIKSKKPIWKPTYCRIPLIGHSGKGKTMESMKRSVVDRGSGLQRWIGGERSIFRVEELLCILQWCIYVITHLPKPITCIWRMNPKVIYGLWLWYIYIGSSLLKTKQNKTIQVNDDNRRSYACAQVGGILEICSPSQFCGKSKTALKNKVLKKVSLKKHGKLFRIKLI